MARFVGERAPRSGKRRRARHFDNLVERDTDVRRSSPVIVTRRNPYFIDQCRRLVVADGETHKEILDIPGIFIFSIGVEKDKQVLFRGRKHDSPGLVGFVGIIFKLLLPQDSIRVAEFAVRPHLRLTVDFIEITCFLSPGYRAVTPGKKLFIVTRDGRIADTQLEAGLVNRFIGIGDIAIRIIRIVGNRADVGRRVVCYYYLDILITVVRLALGKARCRVHFTAHLLFKISPVDIFSVVLGTAHNLVGIVLKGE